MYQLDREKVASYLGAMEKALQLLGRIRSLEEEEFCRDVTLCYAAERCIHICIEVIADVGNLLIDGFVMRDPGSYEDIVQILREEQVLDNRTAEGLKEVVALRRPLIQSYADADYPSLHQLIKNHYQSLQQFSVKVNHYIQRNLLNYEIEVK